MQAIDGVLPPAIAIPMELPSASEAAADIGSKADLSGVAAMRNRPGVRSSGPRERHSAHSTGF
jgi:hypothetical protein